MTDPLKEALQVRLRKNKVDECPHEGWLDDDVEKYDLHCGGLQQRRDIVE